MDEDLQHLQLLSIFHYVLAGFTALFSLLPLFHLAMGVMMATGAFHEGTAPDERAILQVVGAMVTAFAGLFIALGLTFAACLVAAGRFLARRVRHTFCLVVAGLECMLMPFGTVLGVFTLLVLLRDSVKVKFAVAAPAPPPGAA